MTSLLIGPIYLTYEKVKEHRQGKKRIRNTARFEDLRREHEENYFTREEEESRLDQERMKTGFAIPEMADNGHVRISTEWEEERARQLQARERELDHERFRAAALNPLRTGRTGASGGDKRGSWHGDGRSRGASWDLDRGGESMSTRRSLQVNRSGRGFDSNDSLSDRSSRQDWSRSEMSRSREFPVEPQTIEVPREREEEPKDMSSLFVDDLLRERGLSR